METAIQVTPIDQLIIPLEGRAKELITVAGDFKITDEASAGRASDLIKQIQTAWGGIEEQRDGMVRPHNEVVSGYNGRFKNMILVPLKETEKLLKGLLKQWNLTERDRVAKEAAAQRQKEAEERQAWETAELERGREAEALGKPPPEPIKPPPPAPAPPPAEPSKTTRGEYGSTATITENWKYEVTRVEDVPRQFLMVDDKAIRAAIKDGRRVISGTRIWDEGNVRMR
ncbi:MAG TPA: hypothetical protein ENI27_07575 [bacterium]|nr:hypothetical protein [bacterium]